MRTCSRATDTHGTSCGHVNMPNPPNPPPIPTLANTIVALISANAYNACILQALAQNGMPASQGHQESVVNHTNANFLKPHPPMFLKAKEPLEVDDWIHTI